MNLVKHDERAILFVHQRPLRIRSVGGTEVHQRQRVLRVFHSLRVAFECEPADAPMIVLIKLSIDFVATPFVELE